MTRNYYSEINLHIVWHTKSSAPLLTPEVEPLAHRVLRRRLVHTDDVFVHEIGGTQSHVHVCVAVRPTILISDRSISDRSISPQATPRIASTSARSTGCL